MIARRINNPITASGHRAENSTHHSLPGMTNSYSSILNAKANNVILNTNANNVILITNANNVILNEVKDLS